jgi:hypothetical protein
VFDAMATRDDLLGRLDRAIARLSEAAPRLDAADSGRQSAEGEEQWSVQEIMAHLRASDDILVPRVYQLLARDNPPLPAFDERRWAEAAGYDNLPAVINAERLIQRWQELWELLASLPDGDWRRTGLHEEHGSISLTDVVVYLIDHTEEHIVQLTDLLDIRPSSAND